MSWNPVLNIVKELKNKYNKLNGSKKLDFNHMLETVNDEEINSFFDCLQVNQKDEFILIRYGLAEMQRGMWDDVNLPYREARSVVINLDKEELVTCGFRKFFNLNEVEENKIENIQKKLVKARVFEVVDKLDGSMQNARWYNGEVFMNGSMALDVKESWRLDSGKKLLTCDYINMIKDNENLTFTFEYVSKDNPHVVLYEEDDEGLYLLGARDVTNGYQLTHKELCDISKEYNVKVAQKENRSLEELLRLMKEYKSNEKEGWVIRIDDHLIKLKCDDYVNMHRVLDSVSSDNVIIKAITEGHWDDMYAKVPDNYKNRVQETVDTVYNYVEKIHKVSVEYEKTANKETRKDFMLWVKHNVPKFLVSHVINIYLGREKRYLKTTNGRYIKMKEIKEILERLDDYE